MMRPRSPKVERRFTEVAFKRIGKAIEMIIDVKVKQVICKEPGPHAFEMQLELESAWTEPHQEFVIE
jgi:hypothetical protein